MQSGGLSAVRPWSGLVAFRPASGADQQHVAASDLHVGELFPRFKIGDEDWRSRLQPLDLFQERHVDENRARHKPGAHTIDAALLTTSGAEILRMIIEDHGFPITRKG